MTDLGFVEDKIKQLSDALRKAEEFYHIATLYGDPGDRQAALAECKRIREDLLETIQCRDQMIGGANDGTA